MQLRKTQTSLLILLALLTVGCGKQFHLSKERMPIESAWPLARHDLAATGSIEGTFSGKLDIIWEKASNDKPSGPLTIHGGYLIYPGAKRKIKFFDLQDGHFNGRIKVKGAPQSGMIAVDSFGYVGVAFPKSRISCFDLKGGGSKWKQKIFDPLSGLIVADNQLIAVSPVGTVVSFDAITGKPGWTSDLKERTSAAPTLDDDRLLITTDSGSLVSLSLSDGASTNLTSVGAPLMASPVVGDYVYISDYEGTVHALAKQGADPVWEWKVEPPIWHAPALSGGFLYQVHGAGKLTALSAATGQFLWSFNVDDVIVAPPIVVGDFVIVGSKLGRLFSISTADGSLVETRELKGPISMPPISDGQNIYLATDKGVIVCLGDRSTHAAK